MTRGPLRPLRGHLPLKGEDIVILVGLTVQGEDLGGDAGAPPALLRNDYGGAPSDRFAATSP